MKKTSYKSMPEYQVWCSMKKRCNNPSCQKFNHYGGRGISYDPRWERFSSFIEDMGKRPSAAHSLDRRDNNGNYSKSNCKWSTKVDQENNKRTNVRIDFRGRNLTVAEWSRIRGWKYHIIINRIDKGWSKIDALLVPKGIRRSAFKGNSGFCGGI